jgi:hypothetical protein
MTNVQPAEITGSLRHLLTFLGGFLVAKFGLDMSLEDVAASAGAVATLGGVIWSVWAKRKRA